MKVAALDFGTNSFLLLIAEIENGDPTRVDKGQSGAMQVSKVYHDTAEIVRLGQDVNETKKFQPEALARADKTLEKFAAVIKKHKPQKILATATSAARDVSNSDELFKICEKHKIPLEIISGEREAELTFAGVASSSTAPASENTQTMVIDIGGGSTELIFGSNGKISKKVSFDVGAVRMTEMFITSHPPEEVEKNAMINYIAKTIDIEALKSDWEQVSVVKAVAGTPTELARVENKGVFDPNVIEGFKLTTETLIRYEGLFTTTSIQDRISRIGVSEGRADIIFAGTTILRWLCEKMHKSQVLVSTRGLRYGVALSMAAE